MNGVLVKIVQTAAGSELAERSVADITARRMGELGKRVAIFLADPHEALEAALWCYEQDRVPLLCEPDPRFAALELERYEADTLIADAASLGRLKPHLGARAEALEHLIVLPL